jgi:hypothetical protein
VVFRCFGRGNVERAVCKSNVNAARGEILPKVKWRTPLAVRSIGAAAGSTDRQSSPLTVVRSSELEASQKHLYGLNVCSVNIRNDYANKISKTLLYTAETNWSRHGYRRVNLSLISLKI